MAASCNGEADNELTEWQLNILLREGLFVRIFETRFASSQAYVKRHFNLLVLRSRAGFI